MIESICCLPVGWTCEKCGEGRRCQRPGEKCDPAWMKKTGGDENGSA